MGKTLRTLVLTAASLSGTFGAQAKAQSLSANDIVVTGYNAMTGAAISSPPLSSLPGEGLQLTCNYTSVDVTTLNGPAIVAQTMDTNSYAIVAYNPSNSLVSVIRAEGSMSAGIEGATDGLVGSFPIGVTGVHGINYCDPTLSSCASDGSGVMAEVTRSPTLPALRAINRVGGPAVAAVGTVYASGGDFVAGDNPRGLVLKAPDNHCARVKLNNNNTLSVTTITCPAKP